MTASGRIDLTLRRPFAFAIVLLLLATSADTRASVILNGERMPGPANGITFAGTVRSNALPQAGFVVLNLDGPTRLDRLEFEATLVYRNGTNAGTLWNEVPDSGWNLWILPGSTPRNYGDPGFNESWYEWRRRTSSLHSLVRLSLGTELSICRTSTCGSIPKPSRSR